MHLEGGGWCVTLELCAARSRTNLGSSKSWPPTFHLDGFLSDSVLTNPDFYNWNVAFVNYCDGGSFAGYQCVHVILYWYIYTDVRVVRCMSLFGIQREPSECERDHVVLQVCR